MDNDFQYKPHTLLRFEVQVAEHCNLNCINCMHYAPLAEPEFLDIDEYEKDIKRLSDLFCGEVEWIRLMGGEPLLNPKLPEIICMTRKYFPYGHIRIVTNGILLQEYSDSFFELCSEKNIEIWVTKYPLKIDYTNMQNYVKERGCFFGMYGGGEDRSPTMWRFLIDTRGDFDPNVNFYNCRAANGCLSLRHGRMYTCAPAAHSHHLKKYFDLNIACSERNGIDIHKAKNAEEIMEYMVKPIPFCRYCDYLNLCDYEDDFTISSKSRYEWCSFTFSKDDFSYLKKRDVYIYGAGKWGMEMLHRLNQAGIHPISFIVTGSRMNPERISGVEVVEIDKIKFGDKASVIIAVAGKAKIAIQHMLYKKGAREVIPIMKM